jgi:hypothetical protein
VEITLDVIVVSKVSIVLEVIIAITIGCIVAFVIVSKSIKRKKAEERRILTSIVEAEVAAKLQEHLSIQENLAVRPSSSEVEAVANRYDHQLLEGAFAQMSQIQKEDLPEWEVQLAKAEARLKEDTKEAQLLQKYGYINPDISCPYCHEKGTLRTKYLKPEIDFDLTKLITGNHSLSKGAAPSKARHAVQAYCENCSKEWTF